MKYTFLLLLIILCFCVSTNGQVIQTSGPTTFCAGGTVTLTVEPTTNITGYQWIKNGSDLPGEISSTYTANSSGNYSVRLKRPSLTDTIIGVTAVMVNANPKVKVNSPSICIGQTATLTASGAETYS